MWIVRMNFKVYGPFYSKKQANVYLKDRGNPKATRAFRVLVPPTKLKRR